MTGTVEPGGLGGGGGFSPPTFLDEIISWFYYEVRMKSKDQRAPILLTCGLIILDMNAGNGLAIRLSVYLSVSKNDMFKKKEEKKKT